MFVLLVHVITGMHSMSVFPHGLFGNNSSASADSQNRCDISRLNSGYSARRSTVDVKMLNTGVPPPSSSSSSYINLSHHLLQEALV